jgi:hypothetical protein
MEMVVNKPALVKGRSPAAKSLCFIFSDVSEFEIDWFSFDGMSEIFIGLKDDFLTTR